MTQKLKPIIGQQFGRWTVTGESEQRKQGAYFPCLCSCGTKRSVFMYDLRSGKSPSCGCGSRDRETKHGLARTAEYTTWAGLLQRCNNEKNKGYNNYGGRGITVCDRWLDFENFFEDMGTRPPNTSLDRCDNNQGYSKENCRWADKETQDNNKRNNHLLTVGCCTLTVTQWAKELSIHRNTIFKRIKSGWSPEDIISIRPQVQKRKTAA